VSTARVDFTRGAAERIAAVVRLVEQGERDGNPLVYRKVDAVGGKTLRVGTFTGDWQINQSKVVTFYGVTSTPNTATVLNLCNPSVGFSTANTSETRFVIYGKAKYTSGFVAVELQQAGTATCVMNLGGFDLTSLPGYAADAIQLLGHDTDQTSSYGSSEYEDDVCPGPSLRWFSITTCATATSSP
jgi:hypothetical protein